MKGRSGVAPTQLSSSNNVTAPPIQPGQTMGNTIVVMASCKTWGHQLLTCRVYMAEPSACRLMTCRWGAATAAPVAMGGPLPMAPPVRHRWSNAGQPCAGGVQWACSVAVLLLSNTCGTFKHTGSNPCRVPRVGCIRTILLDHRRQHVCPGRHGTMYNSLS
jgi:hypothetical protein